MADLLRGRMPGGSTSGAGAAEAAAGGGGRGRGGLSAVRKMLACVYFRGFDSLKLKRKLQIPTGGCLCEPFAT